ncbi:MAG: glycosyltransferase family 4 protein, partial [Candidatus Margulisbacteria bacterium]|nr:glycosyltransferase family 4 protein [Candidatus Margulisiibacteriota bacterium]
MKREKVCARISLKMTDISKMYLGFINSGIGILSEKNVFGLQVANHQFMQALLDYSDLAGYHYFVTDNLIKTYQKFLKKSFGKHPKYSKIKIIPFSELKSFVQKNNYIAFHHGDPFAGTDYYLRQELGCKKYPVTCFVHTVSGGFVPERLLATLLGNTKKYDVFFCATKALSQALENIFQRIKEVTKTPDNFQGKLINIPFGVDIKRFKPRPKNKIREILKMPKKGIIIGHIGRLTAWNKMDLVPLLEIFKVLLDKLQRKDVYLYIIGKEQHQGYLKLLRSKAKALKIQNKIKFVTNHKNNQIPEYYSALDIFVSPSDHVQETFGITPIEAMASGVPVVVSDWDGYKETVKEGKTGFRIPTYWHACVEGVKDSLYTEGIQNVYMQLGQAVAIDVSKYVEAL